MGSASYSRRQNQRILIEAFCQYNRRLYSTMKLIIKRAVKNYHGRHVCETLRHCRQMSNPQNIKCHPGQTRHSWVYSSFLYTMCVSGCVRVCVRVCVCVHFRQQDCVLKFTCAVPLPCCLMK